MKRFHSPGMQKLEASASKSAQPSAAKRGRGRPTGSGSRQQKPKTVAEKEAEAQRTQANNINQYLERDQHMLDDQASRRRKQANIGDERTSRRSSRRQEANGPEELAKRFLENAKYLEANYVHVHEEAGSENIPATLDDLPEEEQNLNEAGRRLDAFISSASTQRIRNDYELRIKFDCKLYTNVGSLGQVFRLTGTQSELVPQGKIFLPLEMLFLSSPCSGLRCALLAHIARQKEGIQVPFEKFATMLCYIFQCRPDTLKIHQAHAAANSLMKILEAMAQHRVEDNTEVWSIQNANIIFLLDNCWPYMRFAGWLHSQLISLLQMLCRLYLDAEMVDFRHRLATVIQMLLTQLSTTAEDGSGKQHQPSLLSILHHFGTSALVQCVDGDLGRALQLFLLFIQFEQFGVHKVATALSILEHILHEDDECVEVDKEEHQEKLVETPPPESVSPPLSAVFSLLPRVVEKLKESKDSTTLYLAYNRLMDALTIDEHFLRSQTTQSLVMAESSYQEATSLLTKKNINDKMIDTRARSLHRIRDVLQTRRNTCTQGLHRGSTDGVRLSESKSDISSANRLTYASTLYDYSSSDEDREEGKN